MTRVSTTLPLLLFACLFLGSSFASITVNSAVRNKQVDRTIDLKTNVPRVSTVIEISNTGSAALSKYLLAFPAAEAANLAFVTATQDQTDLEVSAVIPDDAKSGVTYYQVKLSPQVNAKASVSITVNTAFVKALTPYPKEVAQGDNQLVLYVSTVHFFSPYATEEENTVVKPTSYQVKSYTEESPVVRKQQDIVYGAYYDVAAYSGKQLRVHYENNSPFALFDTLVREIEVSHWRSEITVEETVQMHHEGAKLAGVFSRLDFQRTQSGVASFRALKAQLPLNAYDAYFRDEIGNISSSSFYQHEEYSDLELRLRFPLFGGWSTAFYYGYAVAIGEFVSVNDDGQYELTFQFGTDLTDAAVEDLTVRIVLPEGASNFAVDAPFAKKLDNDVYYSYLDGASGRPVIVLNQKKVVDEIGDKEIVVTYSYSALQLIYKPVRVALSLFVCFAVAIVFMRLDLRIKTASDKQ
eukprot:TRINITY_DN13430_c0_g1_i1.p1 TRINITY_DN13430_c0_g1~~TRINITY_DN13430_c0_g1_i1.p1  ORF type:complete len:483 (+),score=140.99 TRINITY_DN13430_c0_g1_i1:53-1450(+)